MNDGAKNDFFQDQHKMVNVSGQSWGHIQKGSFRCQSPSSWEKAHLQHLHKPPSGLTCVSNFHQTAMAVILVYNFYLLILVPIINLIKDSFNLHKDANNFPE